MTATYPEATPHDPITEILPDLFVVYGSIHLPPPGMRISRYHFAKSRPRLLDRQLLVPDGIAVGENNLRFDLFSKPS